MDETFRSSGALPTPAGWYPDPSTPSAKRYFDGRRWTEYRVSPSGQPVGPRGWYPDPDVPPGKRLFNGVSWTKYRLPAPTRVVCTEKRDLSRAAFWLAVLGLFPPLGVLFGPVSVVLAVVSRKRFRFSTQPSCKIQERSNNAIIVGVCGLLISLVISIAVYELIVAIASGCSSNCSI